MNVVIISRSKLYREVIRHWINPIENLFIIGEFEDEQQFNAFGDKKDTEILIIDHYENIHTNMYLFKKLRKRYRRMKILIVSMHNDKSFHIALKKCGIKGCIEKYNLNEEIHDALNTIYNGGVHFMAG